MRAATVVLYCAARLSSVCPDWTTTGTQPRGGGQLAGGVMVVVGVRLAVAVLVAVAVEVAVAVTVACEVAEGEAVMVEVPSPPGPKPSRPGINPPSAVASEKAPMMTAREITPIRMLDNNEPAVPLMA
jgi:hypothetical protein